jgi:TPP-dependent 2-oxoacid decarboxylase
MGPIPMQYTAGSYLAARFSQIGLKHRFAAAGDYDLARLDVRPGAHELVSGAWGITLD